MSSDKVDKKTVEEDTKDTGTSEEETEEKTNSKPATKKKAEPPKIKQPAKKRVKTEQAEKESKKEDKKKEKKEEMKEDEEEDEDSAEENGVENHKAVPLLDQPLEVTGSRKRKETQRFHQPIEHKEEQKAVQIPEGKGKALGEIPRVELGIQRAKVDDLKLLHRLCFGKQGKVATLQKNIRKFNGFEFEEASDDYEKKKVTIEKNFKKVTVAHLKNICNIIDIDKAGTKDDILARILSFLTCPVDSGKTLPGEGRTKRKGALSKNYDEGEEKFDSRKKVSTKSKKKDDGSDESGKESEDEKEGSEEEAEEVKQNDKKKDEPQTTEDSAPDEEEDKEEKDEKPKKGGKKGKKAAESTDKKAPPKKRGAAKKAAEKKPEVEKDGDEDNESESDEPLAKKTKTPPTDEEIKTYVKSLLEGANLELITMKKVCQDVYAHYPDFDLGHKKDFIKTTVKSLISS